MRRGKKLTPKEKMKKKIAEKVVKEREKQDDMYFTKNYFL